MICLVTVVSTIHATFLLGPSGLLEALTANVEASVSLIVANLAVIVTHVYRLLRNGEDIDHSPYDVTTNGTRRINGPLKGFANARKGAKTFVSSMHFAAGVETTMGEDTILESTTTSGLHTTSHSGDKTFGNELEMTKSVDIDSPTKTRHETMIFADKPEDLEGQ
ncbi:hypothetical protein HWV62_18766 [Athelia sp. TMB]|nr:hypothetical protein HWV62_36597 [Athelia sp. TMB]KAF7972183.1 hypothetical protein HWV62_18766 [Athelia sp. TMB]